MLLHLAADVARRKKRRFSVLFIDWEAQYQCTIAHILKMREMYRDVTETCGSQEETSFLCIIH
ncbi:hypothetical protein [Escherichia coli]|uniref:hypothetical protein n=1 Tax=Escherichia coli TaxID=562 RepID=UPI003F51F1FB